MKMNAKQKEVLDKVFVDVVDANGQVTTKRSDEKLTLDETAIALSMIEGTKPLTKMAIFKQEKNLMAKLRNKLAAYGITDMSDVFSMTNDRSMAKSFQSELP